MGRRRRRRIGDGADRRVGIGDHCDAMRGLINAAYPRATGMSKTMSGMSSAKGMRGGSLATDVEAELFLPMKDATLVNLQREGCECEDAVEAAVLVNAEVMSDDCFRDLAPREFAKLGGVVARVD
ncbi:hypothetical protein ACHAXT_009610 [Thalassiosira profunda]